MRGKRERTKTVKYIWSGLLFLAVSGILTLIARISLSFSEWYSTYIYKGLVSVIGRLFGKVPFSFVELSLYVVIFLMIGTGIHAAFESRKKSNLAMACGIVFGRLYHAVCICDQLRHQLS